MESISGVERFNEKVLAGSCLVDFWGPSCPPCVGLSKTLVEVEPQFPALNFYSVNADDESELAAMNGVRGLPTLIFFKNGTELERSIGNLSKSKLTDTIERLFGGQSLSS